jgi:hypothetical protein
MLGAGGGAELRLEDVGQHEDRRLDRKAGEFRRRGQRFHEGQNLGRIRAVVGEGNDLENAKRRIENDPAAADADPTAVGIDGRDPIELAHLGVEIPEEAQAGKTVGDTPSAASGGIEAHAEEAGLDVVEDGTARFDRGKGSARLRIGGAGKEA